jgi:hypothetical protein
VLIIRTVTISATLIALRIEASVITLGNFMNSTRRYFADSAMKSSSQNMLLRLLIFQNAEQVLFSIWVPYENFATTIRFIDLLLWLHP